jgi:ribonucleoside-triphosphate reductase
MSIETHQKKIVPENNKDFKPSDSFIQKSSNLIKDYIGQHNWRVKENSNSAYSIQGLYDHIVQYSNALYWLYEIYDKDIRETHMRGDFHIHDLGYLTAYCVGWALEDLLLKGFGGIYGKIKSRPANHFRSALGQIWNFFYTMQGESAGAQAFSSFDTYLAPFVAKDKLSYEEVYQAMEEFIYNMNVPTRAGFQTPFTNITMDLQCPSTLKDKYAIIGGKPSSKKYSEFQNEMDLINKAFCEIMYLGDAKQRIFTFPIPTYNITEDFNWDNENLESLWRLTAKYGIPYFANYCGSDLDPSDCTSMCCRLRIDRSKLDKRGGGLFGSNPLTGSIGVVTINMPRLGYLATSKKDFYSRLDRLMDLAAESLITKRKVIEENTENDLYPYIKLFLSDIKARTGKYWTNHFNTIGLVGMNECCLNFMNKDITHENALDFSKEVLNYMRDRMLEYQEKYESPFNLEATPAEGTSYKLAKYDSEKYKNIISAGTQNNPYYTNSTQIGVTMMSDLFNDLSHQNELQPLYTGGTVFHMYLGENIDDPNSVKLLLKKICTNFKLPYISFTPTFSICPSCGLISGEHEYCPKCVHDEGIMP